jgi:hypothetical protein
MISVNLKWGLGNQLFQYSFGRILAERKGYKLESAGIANLSRTWDSIKGDRYEHPEEELISGYFFIDSIVSNKEKRKISLNGHFQNLNYYKADRNHIKSWLKYGKTSFDELIDTAVHVRRGDYVSIGWALPFSFYRDAIEKVWDGISPLYIATDDKNDPFLRNFSYYNPRFINANALETIFILSRARNLIMSRSSFSWWAAFLGEHDIIACPNPNSGFWGPDQRKFGSIDLVDESEFLCIDCEGTYDPNSIEKRYLLSKRICNIPKRIRNRLRWSEKH